MTEPLYAARAFLLQKDGNAPEECDDAWSVSGHCSTSYMRCRYSVADGATESSFAGPWARLLVDAYVEHAPSTLDELWGMVAGLRPLWAKDVDSRALPWYAEANARKGAFATFLGLQLKRRRLRGDGTWEALAVGDSCLFQVRSGKLLTRFPIAHAEAFGMTPALLPSRERPGERAQTPVLACSGSWRPGDTFYLATDALAQWFLREWEAGHRPWQELAGGEGDFVALVSLLREQRRMRNDDVTLVAVEVTVGDSSAA